MSICPYSLSSGDSLNPTRVSEVAEVMAWSVYVTGYSSYVRGTMIWVRPGVPFTAEESVLDPEGCHKFVKGRLDGKPLLLGCVYAPHTEKCLFSASCRRCYPLGLAPLAHTDLDRSFPPLLRASAASNAQGLSRWLGQWQLTDIWRHRNTYSKVYSFYSSPL